MREINLGMSWDVAPDLASALKADQERAKPQTENGKKLTPAQKRDAAFVEVAQAIENGEFQKVDEVLAAHPKLTFNMGNCGVVYQSLIDNFDPNICKKLLARGLHLTSYSLYQHLLRGHRPSLLEHFVEMCVAEKSTHWLTTIHKQTLKGFTNNVSEQRRKELREYRVILERFDPNMLMGNLNQIEFFSVFTSYTSPLPHMECEQLKTLTAENWEKSFTAWFKDLEKTQMHQHSQIELKVFNNVLSFLNDFPTAHLGWDRAIQLLHTNNKLYKDFIAQYFKPSEDFENSDLSKILEEFHSGYRAISFPFKHNEGASKLGLTSFEMQELGASDWESRNLESYNGVAPPFEKMERYTAPSFVHILVKNASPASLALLESQTGKDLYWECLQEPAVFNSWCKKSSHEMINAVVRACPQMLEWKDQHNNSLAHYLVFLRMESSQAFGQLVARLNHNWLLQDNTRGVSVKDLFKSFGASENMLNLLDKEAIKRSMKDAGIKKTRRSAPATKRRM